MQPGRVIVVGSGVAGLTAALSIQSRPVTVITPGRTGQDGATWLAKGGVAAAVGSDDSPQLHARDTHRAGANRCDTAAVDVLCSAGPDAVRWLETLGAVFDRSNGQLALGQEAAHSAHRIVHAGGDQTGMEVSRALQTAIRASSIEVINGLTLERLSSVDHRIDGVLASDQSGARHHLPADDVVLATGGVGALYPCTTNPANALGTGIACAIEAGAQVRDMAMVQFHPTALDSAGESGFAALLTEALRGAGAYLIDAGGRRFMRALHPDAELAPRDIVSRAIWHQAGDIFLDVRHLADAQFWARFPAAWAACQQAGIDPGCDPIPVRPAAHYHMGGLLADLDGRTSVTGLWACGECASTGVHGANRLASNSLLEGLVFGRRLGQAVDAAPARKAPELGGPAAAPRDASRIAAPSVSNPDWAATALKRIQTIMWSGMGLIRSESALLETRAQLLQLADDAESRDRTIQLASITALSMVDDALLRRESVGAHCRSDYQSLEKTA